MIEISANQHGKADLIKESTLADEETTAEPGLCITDKVSAVVAKQPRHSNVECLTNNDRFNQKTSIRTPTPTKTNGSGENVNDYGNFLE